MQYGFDVAATRADDLDKLAVQYVASITDPDVLDLGCGAGGQALRLAQAGARVFAVDIEDYARRFEQLRQAAKIRPAQLHFMHADIRHFIKRRHPSEYNAAMIQRVLHYLQYTEARDFLSNLHTIVSGKIFVSVTGVESAIGERYVARQDPIENRFAYLDTKKTETFFITEPVCLYTRKEYVALLESTGWHIEKIWTSAFGNHKAVCY